MHQLYDAVQPWAFWKQIFASIYHELLGSQRRIEVLLFLILQRAQTQELFLQPFQIAAFVTSEFGVQDQEGQLVHLPTIFCAIVEILTVSCI
jgi:hypothetical protein